jgi:DNA-binding transcriptional ArsR family regulator
LILNIHIKSNIVKIMARKKKTPAAKAAKSGSAGAAEAAAADIPATFLLTTVEQLRSISVPVRLAILQALAEKAMTTKQVAEQLGEPATRLYHHVDALARAGLIVLVEEVPKRGTVQRFYRAVAQSFRADEGCFGSEETRDERARILLDMLEATRRGIARCLRDAAQADSAIAAAATLPLSGPGQAKELAELLTTTIKKWARAKCSKKKCDQGTGYRVALFLHPDQERA